MELSYSGRIRGRSSRPSDAYRAGAEAAGGKIIITVSDRNNSLNRLINLNNLNNLNSLNSQNSSAASAEPARSEETPPPSPGRGSPVSPGQKAPIPAVLAAKDYYGITRAEKSEAPAGFEKKSAALDSSGFVTARDGSRVISTILGGLTLTSAEKVFLQDPEQFSCSVKNSSFIKETLNLSNPHRSKAQTREALSKSDPPRSNPNTRAAFDTLSSAQNAVFNGKTSIQFRAKHSFIQRVPDPAEFVELRLIKNVLNGASAISANYLNEKIYNNKAANFALELHNFTENYSKFTDQYKSPEALRSFLFPNGIVSALGGAAFPEIGTNSASKYRAFIFRDIAGRVRQSSGQAPSARIFLSEFMSGRYAEAALPELILRNSYFLAGTGSYQISGSPLPGGAENEYAERRAIPEAEGESSARTVPAVSGRLPDIVSREAAGAVRDARNSGGRSRSPMLDRIRKIVFRRLGSAFNNTGVTRSFKAVLTDRSAQILRAYKALPSGSPPAAKNGEPSRITKFAFNVPEQTGVTGLYDAGTHYLRLRAGNIFSGISAVKAVKAAKADRSEGTEKGAKSTGGVLKNEADGKYPLSAGEFIFHNSYHGESAKAYGGFTSERGDGGLRSSPANLLYGSVYMSDLISGKEFMSAFFSSGFRKGTRELSNRKTAVSGAWKRFPSAHGAVFRKGKNGGAAEITDYHSEQSTVLLFPEGVDRRKLYGIISAGKNPEQFSIQALNKSNFIRSNEPINRSGFDTFRIIKRVLSETPDKSSSTRSNEPINGSGFDTFRIIKRVLSETPDKSSSTRSNEPINRSGFDTFRIIKRVPSETPDKSSSTRSNEPIRVSGFDTRGFAQNAAFNSKTNIRFGAKLRFIHRAASELRTDSTNKRQLTELLHIFSGKQSGSASVGQVPGSSERIPFNSSIGTGSVTEIIKGSNNDVPTYAKGRSESAGAGSFPPEKHGGFEPPLYRGAELKGSVTKQIADAKPFIDKSPGKITAAEILKYFTGQKTSAGIAEAAEIAGNIEREGAGKGFYKAEYGGSESLSYYAPERRERIANSYAAFGYGGFKDSRQSGNSGSGGLVLAAAKSEPDPARSAEAGGEPQEKPAEAALPEAEELYRRLNISESIRALLSSEEAMKSYIRSSISSYISEAEGGGDDSASGIVSRRNTEIICERIFARLERRLKTERRLNGR